MVSVQEVIDTGRPMGRAFVQIAAVFAELERGLIGERVKAVLRNASTRAANGPSSTNDRGSAEWRESWPPSCQSMPSPQR